MLRPARAAVCVALAALLTVPAAARADDRTWTGGSGTDSLWTTADNWLDTTAPVAGDALFFGGTTRLAPENDITADTSFAGITFNSGAGAFVLSGNRITLGGNVTNNAANAQSVQLDMILDATRTVAGSGNTTLQGILSGGGGLAKSGGGILTLSGSSANTYNGLTTVSGGRLVLGKSANVTAVPGNLDISDGAKVTFRANSVNQQIANDAAVTMSGATSAFNCTGFNADFRIITETIGSLGVTGGVFHTGMGTWIVTGAASFTGGAGNTIFVGNSGGTAHFDSLSLTNMNAESSGNVNNSFNVYGSDGSTQTSIFVGSGGLTLNNSVIYLRLGGGGAKGSRLVLDGNVATTGTSASSIAIGAAGAGDVSVQLSSTAAPVTRTFNIGGDGANLTISVPITNGASDSAGILKTGDGTLTLSAANTYTGGTTINQGTVQFGANDVLADTGAVTVSGGTLGIGSYSDTVGALTLTGGSVLGTTGVLTASSYDVRSGTISAALGGSGALTKTTNGTVTLSGTAANTYTGLTTVSAGTLALGKTTAGVNAVPGDLAISGGAVTFNADQQIASGAAVTMSGASSVFNGTAFNSGYRAQNETIGSLVVNGGSFNTGTGGTGWIVTGAASFTGGAGDNNTRFLGHSTSTSRFGSLSLTGMTGTAGGTPTTANSFTLYGNNAGKQSSIFVGAGGLTLDNSVINLRRGSVTNARGSRLVLDGNVLTTGTSASRISEDTAGGTIGNIAVELSSTAGNHTRTFNIGDGADLTISVPITNGASDSAGILKTGDGTLTLSAANTYTGGTTINQGTVQLGANDVLADTGAVTVSGGTLDINTRSDTVGALTLTSGSVTGTTGVLTASSYAVRSGTISAALGGSGALTKTTGGTVTLSGATANTYTGLTTVSAGTLSLGKTTAGVNAVPGNLAISSGGKVTFSTNEQIADGAAVTMSGASSIFNGTSLGVGFAVEETIDSLDVTGGVFNSGSGPGWTVTGAGSFTGGANTIFVGNSASTTSFGSLSLTGMNATAGTTSNTADSFTLYGAWSSKQSSVFVGSGGLTLDNSVINLRRGGTNAKGSRLVLNGNVLTTGTSASRISEDTAGGSTGNIAVELSSTSGNHTRTFNIGDGADLTISVPVTDGQADIAGIIKTGLGTLTLSAANAFTGPTTVEAGTLLVNGSITSDVTVDGGWLKGDGTVGGVVVNALGSISAGNSPGLLTVDGNYEQSGLLLAELAGTTQGSTYDSIDVSGTATFNPGALIQVDLLGGFEPLFGDFFDILTADQGITNTDLSGIVFDYSGAMSTYPLVASIVSLGGSAEALRLSAIPEPSALILLCFGAAGLLAWPVRRRKRAA